MSLGEAKTREQRMGCPSSHLRLARKTCSNTSLTSWKLGNGRWMPSPNRGFSEAAQPSKICLMIESSIIVVARPSSDVELHGGTVVKATTAVRLKVASIVVRSAINSRADKNCSETTALCQPHIGCVSTA